MPKYHTSYGDTVTVTVIKKSKQPKRPAEFTQPQDIDTYHGGRSFETRREEVIKPPLILERYRTESDGTVSYQEAKKPGNPRSVAGWAYETAAATARGTDFRGYSDDRRDSDSNRRQFEGSSSNRREERPPRDGGRPASTSRDAYADNRRRAY